MSWPTLLVLVRHAESEGNIRNPDERAEYEIATYAYPLTKLGQEQAEKTGRYLRQNFGQFDVFYTSYYERAKETMRIMYPAAKVYEDPRLAEGQRGIFHTMTKTEIAKVYPHELHRKQREGIYHYRPPGGENWPDMELRIHSFLGTLNRDCGGRKVLMVVHGHWLLLLQRLLEHFSIDEAIKRYDNSISANAAVSVYTGMNNRLELQKYVIPWEGDHVTKPLG
jgi:probable phosphoglycerate mutase